MTHYDAVAALLLLSGRSSSANSPVAPADTPPASPPTMRECRSWVPEAGFYKERDTTFNTQQAITDTTTAAGYDYKTANHKHFTDSTSPYQSRNNNFSPLPLYSGSLKHSNYTNEQHPFHRVPNTVPVVLNVPTMNTYMRTNVRNYTETAVQNAKMAGQHSLSPVYGSKIMKRNRGYSAYRHESPEPSYRSPVFINHESSFDDQDMKPTDLSMKNNKITSWGKMTDMNNVQYLPEGSSSGPSEIDPDKQSGKRSPSDSGHSSMGDEICNLTPPVPAVFPVTSASLPKLCTPEFDNMVRETAFKKFKYTDTQMEENPIDFGYNPNKSRMLRTYSDPRQAAERAKNNEASRRSRHKKKIQDQIVSIYLEYTNMENRAYWEEEKALMSLIVEAEEQCLQAGLDANTINNIRGECGFRKNGKEVVRKRTTTKCP